MARSAARAPAVRRAVGRARRVARDRGRGRARARPRALRDRAGRHHHRRPLAAGRRGARARSSRAPTRCRSRSRSTASPPRASASWSPIRRTTCRVTARRDVRRRRRAPAAARPLRGGRHRAGALRARRPPVRRLGRASGSAVAMDKIMMKRAFAAARAPHAAAPFGSATGTTSTRSWPTSSASSATRAS